VKRLHPSYELVLLYQSDALRAVPGWGDVRVPPPEGLSEAVQYWGESLDIERGICWGGWPHPEELLGVKWHRFQRFQQMFADAVRPLYQGDRPSIVAGWATLNGVQP